MVKAGGLLIAFFLFVLALAGTVSPAAAQCAPPIGCPTPTPYTMPSSDPPADNGGGDWGGYNDGRLNGTPDEYYSIWCAYDQVEVWKAGQLLDTLQIVSLINLGEGETGGLIGMLYSRSGDIVTISGNNGNGAPNPGSKSFSLQACIEANGGVPEAPPPPPPPQAPPEEESPAFQSSSEDYTGLEILWRSIQSFCGINVTGTGIVIVGIPYLLKRRKRR